MKVTILRPNSLEIETKIGHFLQSYQTVIAFQGDASPAILVLEDQPQSKTTARHLYQWLGINNKVYRQWLKDGKVIETRTLPLI